MPHEGAPFLPSWLPPLWVSCCSLLLPHLFLFSVLVHHPGSKIKRSDSSSSIASQSPIGWRFFFPFSDCPVGNGFAALTCLGLSRMLEPALCLTKEGGAELLLANWLELCPPRVPSFPPSGPRAQLCPPFLPVSEERGVRPCVDAMSLLARFLLCFSSLGST